MKHFLYLVQSRAEDAQKLLKLESDRSDVLILTFDKQLAGTRFIYGPNTIWPTGRNMLIEKARNLANKYDYYIMLDDDVELRKGSFREFEDEVLSIKPELCTPLFYNLSKARLICRLLPLKYSVPVVGEDYFICINHSLFHNPQLLPYRTEFTKLALTNEDPALTFYAHFWFWTTVATDFWGGKIISLQHVQARNSRSAVDYDFTIRTYLRFWNLNPEPEQLMSLKRNIPIYYTSLIRRKMPLLPERIQLLLKSSLSPDSAWNIYRAKNLITIIKFLLSPHNRKSHKKQLTKLLRAQLFYKPFIRYLCPMYICVRLLWKNIKLNLKIRLKQNWRTSDF